MSLVAAIRTLPKEAWTQAINADSSLLDGADVAELTSMQGDLTAGRVARPGCE
jgi:hypothetical protein